MKFYLRRDFSAMAPEFLARPSASSQRHLSNPCNFSHIRSVSLVALDRYNYVHNVSKIRTENS